jgi:site-specific recombinase XerD
MARWGVADLPTWRTIEAALAPSTNKAYSTTFKCFLQFISKVGRDMDSVTVVDVLSFLQEYVDKQRAASTMRQLHAALLHFFTLFQKSEIISSPVIALFVQGAQRLAPSTEKLPFIWDPEVPLQYLAKLPFPTTVRAAGQEALLLLLLATGIRVSDAHRLSRKMTKAGEVWMIPFLERRKTGPSPPQLVKPFSSPRLCPARALQRYLAIANPIRADGERFLFISSRGQRACVDTLRHWVVDLLEAAGIQAPAGSCRSASTSSAITRNVDVDQILKSAGWASESTFRRYYHRALKPVNDCASLLPPME